MHGRRINKLEFACHKLREKTAKPKVYLIKLLVGCIIREEAVQCRHQKKKEGKNK